MDLIDREALSKELCNKCGRKDCTGITDTEICIAQFIINTIKAVDAVPVVHEHWIDDSCSRCGFKILQKTRNYCPKCGAKMDEVSK